MNPSHRAGHMSFVTLPLTRRAAIGSIGAGGLAFAARSLAGAQEATPGAAPAVVEAWFAA